MPLAKPPAGFRGVFLWTPQRAEPGTVALVPAARVGEALAAMCCAALRPAAPGTPPADPPAGSAPLAGIVVVGRWLGAKPADGSWGVDSVEVDGDSFVVLMDGGRIQVTVRGPGPATIGPGPYGDLLTVDTARDVIVTVNGAADDWLPSVRGHRAYDMRGRPARWPRRRPPTERSILAVRLPVPALMFSVWRAGPLPADLTVTQSAPL